MPEIDASILSTDPEDYSEGDPLRGVLENALSAQTALYEYLFKTHYEDYAIEHAEAACQFADEEAEKILLLIFPYFKKILVASQYKAGVEAWNAAKQNLPFPEFGDK